MSKEKVELELIRVGSRIYYPTGELNTDWKTVNKAKKASRDYQKSKGGLGLGHVRVALKAPQISAVAA
jgi:hypothetical protein